MPHYPVLLDNKHNECDKSTHYYDHTTEGCYPCDCKTCSGRIKMSAQSTGGHDSSACEATIPQDEVSHAGREDMSRAQVFIECGSGYTCEAPFVCDRETSTCLPPEDKSSTPPGAAANFCAGDTGLETRKTNGITVSQYCPSTKVEWYYSGCALKKCTSDTNTHTESCVAYADLGSEDQTNLDQLYTKSIIAQH